MLKELIMLHILNSPDRKLTICGKYRSHEGIQKEEMRMCQNKSHRPYLLALNGYAHCTCYGRASVRLSQDQQTTVYRSQPALCLFLYGLCVRFIYLNVWKNQGKEWYFVTLEIMWKSISSSIDKVVSEHNHTLLLIHCLWLLSHHNNRAE